MSMLAVEHLLRGLVFLDSKFVLTAKCVSGKKGDRIAAEYSLAADDLYVRARVESDAPAPYYVLGGKGAMHPKVAMAWTQPYAKAT